MKKAIEQMQQPQRMTGLTLTAPGRLARGRHDEALIVVEEALKPIDAAKPKSPAAQDSVVVPR